jgi:uncharacterized OB-fold protein
MSDTDQKFLLPERVRPVAGGGLDGPFWEGLRNENLILQYCPGCLSYQWGPEYVCYRCGTFDVKWVEVPKADDGFFRGVVYSWQRIWHPVDPSLASAVPYVAVLVELPDADNVRLMGNLVDPPDGPIPIGADLSPVFEHHSEYSLLLWRLTRQ